MPCEEWQLALWQGLTQRAQRHGEFAAAWVLFHMKLKKLHWAKTSYTGSKWGLHGLISNQLKTRVPVKHVAVTTLWCHYHCIATERRTLIIEANQTPFSNTMAWFHFQDLNMHHVPVNIDISCAFAYKQFVDIHVCYMYALHILLKKKHFAMQKLQFHLSFCSLSLPYLQSSTLQIRLL